MKGRPIRLPAPYLKRVWLDRSRVPNAAAYPFCLPFLNDGFALDFERAITIIVGENGTGKSTLLEGIAALAGYDEAGGGKGYRPVDHSRALEVMGGSLAHCGRLGCRRLPMAGSSAPKASFPWRATLMKRPESRSADRRPTFYPIRMAKDFCGSSRSAAAGKASL